MSLTEAISVLLNVVDGSFLVDGHYPFHYFLDHFGLAELADGYDFNTVGGLILEIEGNIPKLGDVVTWRNFNFEILDMDGPRINKILVRLLKPS